MARNIYMSKIFKAISRQIIAAASQEEMLAKLADQYFVDRFRPVAKELSAMTGRTYIDYLFEAEELITKGISNEETFKYFVERLLKLKAMQEGKP